MTTPAEQTRLAALQEYRLPAQFSAPVPLVMPQAPALGSLHVRHDEPRRLTTEQAGAESPGGGATITFSRPAVTAAAA